MKKTFRKISGLVIIMILSLTVLSGCFKNQVVAHQGQIRLYLDESFTTHMSYEQVPDFTFTFEGTINTIANVPDTNATVFASNDDVVFSAMVAELIEEYSVYTEVVATKEVPTTQINTLDDNNKTVVHQYPVDGGITYDEVAYLSLDNGLKMTINYRRFVSDGITYYCWRYTSNITFYLYYPLMIIEESGTKKIVLLALPNRVTFQVGSQLKASNILSKDEYLNATKYTFAYPEVEGDKVTYVKEYYLNNHEGYEVENGLEDDFYFQYLGIRYQVLFHDQSFTLQYIGPVNPS